MDRLPAHPPSLLLKMSWKCTFWCLPHPRGCHLTLSLSVDPRLRLPSSCFLGHDPKGSLQTGEGTNPSTLPASHGIRNRFTSELTNSDMSHSHLNFLLLNYSHDTSFPAVVHSALSDSLCKSNCSFLKTLALVPKFLTPLSLIMSKKVLIQDKSNYLLSWHLDLNCWKDVLKKEKFTQQDRPIPL